MAVVREGQRRAIEARQRIAKGSLFVIRVIITFYSFTSENFVESYRKRLEIADDFEFRYLQAKEPGLVLVAPGSRH